MKVVSVNVASVAGEISAAAKRKVKTGIFKKPQSHRVQVGSQGIEGDFICNRKHHGGKDQAIYAYSTEDYAFWSRSLNSLLGPGAFGENLTVSGIDFSALCIAIIYLIRSVLLESS